MALKYYFTTRDLLVTIYAKPNGAVTHLSVQNYTGLPIWYVLNDARM